MNLNKNDYIRTIKIVNCYCYNYPNLLELLYPALETNLTLMTIKNFLIKIEPVLDAYTSQIKNKHGGSIERKYCQHLKPMAS